MYVTPAVRSIRDDPVPGETVTLLLETTDSEDVEAVAETASDLGTVRGERPFGTVEVTVPHERVADVCTLSGVATVETTDTLTVDAGGAGEDVRPGE